MPYELTIVKKVPLRPRDEYINECCVGGDAIVDRLLPAVAPHYADVDSAQEDWGWFIWSRQGDWRLAVDVFTDDPQRGEFRIHVTASKPRWMRRDIVEDIPELDVLRDRVVGALQGWVDGDIKIERIESD